MKSFPLKILGMDIQRNVTLLGLNDGRLVIHSTAPFSAADISEIRKIGNPKWMVDVLLRHTTFAKNGAGAFPGIRYLAPAGFSEDAGVPTDDLLDAPAEWQGQIEVLPIHGVPDFSEIVMLHVESKSLVVGDLIFNFPRNGGFVKNLFLSLGSVGGKHDPGMTKPFQNAIKDGAAYLASIRKVLDWDFDRIIVGHGEFIETGGKQKLAQVFKDAGYPID